MPASISGHRQSTLPDGRVLISGGADNNGYLNTVYIYNPNSNKWSEIASLPANIIKHRQSVLLNGKVLVSGGENNNSEAINTVFIYTPSNLDIGSWVTASPLPSSFNLHGQSTLNDGRVMVSGGVTNSSGSVRLNTSYIYTPNGTWTPVATTPTVVAFHGQSTLLDGRILISGNSGMGSAIYIYNPSGNTWSSASPMPAGFYYHGQSTLMDGRVLVSGGQAARNNVYIYTPSSNTWNEVASLPIGVRGHVQSTLADGRVMLSGGYDGTNRFNTAYIYTPTGWVAVCFL